MQSLKIQEYMNHYPVTFTESMSVEEASLRFLKTKQIGGPVIDQNYKVLGFISEGDVLKKMLERIQKKVKSYFLVFWWPLVHVHG